MTTPTEKSTWRQRWEVEPRQPQTSASPWRPPVPLSNVSIQSHTTPPFLENRIEMDWIYLNHEWLEILALFWKKRSKNSKLLAITAYHYKNLGPWYWPFFKQGRNLFDAVTCPQKALHFKGTLCPVVNQGRMHKRITESKDLKKWLTSQWFKKPISVHVNISVIDFERTLGRNLWKLQRQRDVCSRLVLEMKDPGPPSTTLERLQGTFAPKYILSSWQWTSTGV